MMHSLLFIFNFKRIKRVLSWLSVFVMVLFICQYLNWIYWSENEWGRKLWNSFYSQENNIDNVFIGSSHVYCDINPELLDFLNEKNNFNMSSGSLNLNAAYYCLKEVAKENDLQNVYLELYYAPSVGQSADYYADDQVKNAWRTTDYMKLSANKIQAIADMSRTKLAEALFPFIRFRQYIGDYEYINQVREQKNTEDFRNYNYIRQIVDEENPDNNWTTEYCEKGFYYSTRTLKSSDVFYKQDEILTERPLGVEPERYLRKIIEYCQNKDINICLIVSPVYDIQLISTQNYDLYLEQIKEVVLEYGVPFYDFNLCKSEYLDIQHVDFFKDVGHLNSKGAQLFTEFLWSVVSNENPNENEKFFYNTYNEKLESEPVCVYGLYYKDSEPTEDNLDVVRTVKVASNKEKELEYRICLTPTGSDTMLVQDFNDNSVFEITPNDHGICKIEARMVDGLEEIQTIDINY